MFNQTSRNLLQMATRSAIKDATGTTGTPAWSRYPAAGRSGHACERPADLARRSLSSHSVALLQASAAAERPAGPVSAGGEHNSPCCFCRSTHSWAPAFVVRQMDYWSQCLFAVAYMSSVSCSVMYTASRTANGFPARYFAAFVCRGQHFSFLRQSRLFGQHYS